MPSDYSQYALSRRIQKTIIHLRAFQLSTIFYPGARQEHCALGQDRNITPGMALSIRTVIPGINIAGVRLIFAGRAWVVFSIVSGLCFLTVMFIAPKDYFSAS